LLNIDNDNFSSRLICDEVMLMGRAELMGYSKHLEPVGGRAMISSAGMDPCVRRIIRLAAVLSEWKTSKAYGAIIS
jgi:hypothetical protein